MDESEWQTAAHPYSMLNNLEGRASDRKLMLFSVACLRRIWHLLTDARSRMLVEVTEAFVDDLASEEQACRAYDAFYAAYEEGDVQDGAGGNTHEAVENVAHAGTMAAIQAASGAAESAGYAATETTPVLTSDALFRVRTEAWSSAANVERSAQADLLRCIFGPLPFRPPVAVSPAVLAWDGGIASKLASYIYRERDLSPQSMGVLADALEEAGLDDSDLLGHLRGPGPHVRGCFVLDLLLDRA